MLFSTLYIKEKTEEVINNYSFKNFYKGLKNAEIIISVNANTSSRVLKRYVNKWIYYRKSILNMNIVKIQVYNYTDNNYIIREFLKLIEEILKSQSLYELYEKSYFMACDYLDYHFYSKNVCDFCNDKCGGKKMTDSVVGCCHYFKNRLLGPLLPGNKLINCNYLGSDGHCQIKSIGCKLFTCDYLNKKGVKFRTKDVFPLYSIFNCIQRLMLVLAIYTPHEKTLYRISKIPNFKFFNFKN